MKEIESKRKNGEDEVGNEQKAISDDPVTDPSEEVHRKEDNPHTSDADVAMEPVDKDRSDVLSSSERKSRGVVLARDKFTCCNSCSKSIVGRILVCAGCKEVAYCNFKCQKASWKVHKKVCSYALRKGGKESTG